PRRRRPTRNSRIRAEFPWRAVPKRGTIPPCGATWTLTSLGSTRENGGEPMADRRTDLHHSGRSRDLGDAPRSSPVPSRVGPPRGLAEIGAPQVLDPVIDRRAVSAQFDAMYDRTVVIVDAPAGYGKTTAALQYAQRNERPTAWLTVAPGEHALPAVLRAL